MSTTVADYYRGSGGFERTAILTPHHGELAHLTGVTKEAIAADPERHAREASARWNAVVVLKGALTIVAGDFPGRWTLETYADEGLLTRGAKIAPAFEHAVHSLRESPHVTDIRNIGLVGAIELESIAGSPGKRAFDVFRECFQRGVLIRTTGDIIALSPPLIVEESHIDQAISTIADVLKTVS